MRNGSPLNRWETRLITSDVSVVSDVLLALKFFHDIAALCLVGEDKERARIRYT